jgi:hypothetical protein
MILTRRKKYMPQTMRKSQSRTSFIHRRNFCEEFSEHVNNSEIIQSGLRFETDRILGLRFEDVTGAKVVAVLTVTPYDPVGDCEYFTSFHR